MLPSTPLPRGHQERATSRSAHERNARGADRTERVEIPRAGGARASKRITHGELVRLRRRSRGASESGAPGTVLRKQQRPLTALTGKGRRQRPISLAGHKSIYAGIGPRRSARDDLRPSKSPSWNPGGLKAGLRPGDTRALGRDRNERGMHLVLAVRSMTGTFAPDSLAVRERVSDTFDWRRGRPRNQR